MSEGGSVPFTFVAEDLAYPMPSAKAADSYIFYVGFDPQALSPEPKAKAQEEEALSHGARARYADRAQMRRAYTCGSRAALRATRRDSGQQKSRRSSRRLFDW